MLVGIISKMWIGRWCQLPFIGGFGGHVSRRMEEFLSPNRIVGASTMLPRGTRGLRMRLAFCVMSMGLGYVGMVRIRE